ncbi:MAG: aspartyl protease family protein [Flavobacteriaceae bacterium]
MGNIHKILVFSCLIVIVLQGCSVKWTEAIGYGSVSSGNTTEVVAIEIQKKLIIVPITIGKKEYRFLFDTGAPFSISNQIQKDENFKIVSKGNIVDSDYNKKKVNWVQVDSIGIGKVLFSNQTAFVGDFDANPIIKCLEIDGIIGSNLIRNYNWTIDQKQNSLSLSDIIEIDTFKESVVIPFKTDYQYNIFIDAYFGQTKLKNILVDYGSNGSIALNDEIFSALKEKNIIGETFIERGVNQSGIIGKPVGLNREITYSDSVRTNGLQHKNVIIRTGKTVSIGNDFLSRFNVTIDWINKKLYLSKYGKEVDSVGSAGFRLGYTIDKGVYIQSVMEKSDAYYKGVRPNMRVVKIDSLDFERGNSFCDYVDHEPGDEILLGLVDSKGQRIEYLIIKTFFKNN